MKRSIQSIAFLPIAVVVALASLAGQTATVFAESDKDKADVLFKQGKKLMADKRYADACQAFEQSYKLDPGIGGKLNIARCYEEWGKLARAYRAYRQAEQAASDAHDARASKIHELVEALAPQVPHVNIKFPAGADHSPHELGKLSLTIDGASIEPGALGDPQLVDPGPHQVEYLVAGARKSKVVAVERGGKVEVMLELPVTEATTTDVSDHSKPGAPAQPRVGRTQRIAGIATGSVGVAMVGISSYMALSARSKYKDALAKDCGGMTNACDAAGLTATHDARHEANVATFVFTLGLAAVGGGVALYLLAPHGHDRDDESDAFYIVPTVDAQGGGLVVGGRL